ncbi:MAG TPA: phosphotransferase [Pseudomonas sp.]|uniref:phosphotransferase n=1 Tax=Pseudomonas sp. TaxID=306 RepID=UPI002B46902D|nr:phosphotransferase [Pseudomonas sp.]HKS14096.1 phosphotransferase [Pseudomonas sp.]
MNATLHSQAGCKTLYRWHSASLEDNLHSLLPQLGHAPLSITTRELAGNASFVNYVRHHQFVHPATGRKVQLVEKSIRKLAFIGSQEARFHRARGMLEGSQHFRHPACLGVIETPWESLIFTEFVRGKVPRMQVIARPLALGIAELESLSHHYIEAQPLSKAPLLWSMDFYRPWFLLRPRFNFARCLPALHQLGQTDDRFRGLTDAFKGFEPLLARDAAAARHSPRCISHMDYLRKNLIVNRPRLQLIDWSEVKVGRVGFDGGAYLGNMFRRKEMSVFLSAQWRFFETYSAALAPNFDTEDAMRNVRYMFLLNALFHCLRPETITEYQEKERMPLLREKYDYLLGLIPEMTDA